MDYCTYSFDLDTHPIHTLMYLSGLRTEILKTRYFTNDGTYLSFSKGIDALNAEKDWIRHFYEFYINHQSTVFCLATISGTTRDNCKLLDQSLLSETTFTEFKEDLNTTLKIDHLPLNTFFFIEQITTDGRVYVYVMFCIDLSKTELDHQQLYTSLYALSESGGFYQHEYGIYPCAHFNEILINTRNNIHDGLLIHNTEYPWFQKKYEYIGNLQGFASLIVMIGAVLFFNKILSLPFGFVLLALIVGLGSIAFVRSRKNTS